MTRRKIYLVLSVLIFCFSFWLLVTSHWLLVHPVFFYQDMPLGTLTIWTGLIALPCIIYYAIPGFHPPISEYHAVFRIINLFIILIALSWGIVSYFLAGNWTFTFNYFSDSYTGSSRAFDVFVQYTFFTVALPFVFILVFLFGILIKLRNKRKK